MGPTSPMAVWALSPPYKPTQPCFEPFVKRPRDWRLSSPPRQDVSQCRGNDRKVPLPRPHFLSFPTLRRKTEACEFMGIMTTIDCPR